MLFLMYIAPHCILNMRNLGKKYQYYCKCQYEPCGKYFELNRFKKAGLYCSLKCRNAAQYIKNKSK